MDKHRKQYVVGVIDVAGIAHYRRKSGGYTSKLDDAFICYNFIVAGNNANALKKLFDPGTVKIWKVGFEEVI